VLYSELFTTHLEQLKTGELSTAVEVLIEKAFAISRTQFWIKKNQPVRDAAGLRKFRRYFARLLANEPLAYILKEKEFFGEKFAANPNVLIPRPETELLVEKALALIGKKKVSILDSGAGSGNIAIILALNSNATVMALEKSKLAAAVLKKNIARFNLQKKVMAIGGDFFPGRQVSFDMIVSNPPYLSQRDWQHAPTGIKLFEPKSALVAGPKGTEALEKIIAGVPRYLKPGGYLLLEIGQGQHLAVLHFLAAANLRELECVRDYQGIERVVVACR
jgi:release factor glutamine methyltransferase